jgi:hypothetical protein
MSSSDVKGRYPETKYWDDSPDVDARLFIKDMGFLNMKIQLNIVYPGYIKVDSISCTSNTFDCKGVTINRHFSFIDDHLVSVRLDMGAPPPFENPDTLQNRYAVISRFPELFDKWYPVHDLNLIGANCHDIAHIKSHNTTAIMINSGVGMEVVYSQVFPMPLPDPPLPGF